MFNLTNPFGFLNLLTSGVPRKRKDENWEVREEEKFF
jgi:hypothetical protein